MADDKFVKQLENGILLLMEIRQKMEDGQDGIEPNKFIKDLFEIRSMMLSIVNMHGKEMMERREKFIDSSEVLHEVNASICKISGHAFSPWDECCNVRGPRAVVERECAVCGKVERIYAPPGQVLTAKEEGKPLAKRMNS